MPTACGHLVDIGPVPHIALPVVVTSHGDHGAVGLEPYRVSMACGDLVDVCPPIDTALPVKVISQGDHGAVGL
jgi:hypothetical protein